MKNLIYHYSDINALKSILENRNIWLTGHSFLNDETEFVEGFDLLKSYIASHLKSKKIPIDAGKVISEIQEHLEETMVFSASFSRDKDLLSQWRSYCPREGGFAIGFDESVLSKEICGHNPKGNNRRLENCLYEKEEKNRQANVIAEGYIEGFSRHCGKQVTKRDLYLNCFLEFLQFCVRSKNSWFSEEKEARLFTYSHKISKEIQIPDESGFPPLKMFCFEEINFRTKSNVLIPYLSQIFPATSIKEIVIGPSRNSELSKQGVLLLLGKLGMLEKCTVIKSSIPFRDI